MPSTSYSRQAPTREERYALLQGDMIALADRHYGDWALLDAGARAAWVHQRLPRMLAEMMPDADYTAAYELFWGLLEVRTWRKR